MSWSALIFGASQPMAYSLSSLGIVLFAGGIHLVERRGKKGQLGPGRQVDVSTLLESIPEAAVMVDSAGRVVDANSAAAHLAGRRREQMRGVAADEMAGLSGEVDGLRDSIVRRALAGRTVRHERRILHHRRTGVASELLISANPILDDDGHVLAALLIARDITELTQLQRRVDDVERHRAVGQMAAGLAHDFNNILDTISQAAAVLELNMDRPAAERKPLLDMIQNTVRRGAEIVQRIREYLRTGTGTVRPLDLCSIIQEAVELTRPLWQKAGVEVNTHLSSVPQVHANAADLRRVFTNLIINSIEAMPRGGQITIGCEARDNRAVATVTDTGMGIPPEQQKKVFFPYFTTKASGTGLGLSGAQKILLSYGGNVSVHSEVGKGTTFTIVLPATEATPERLPAAGEESAIGRK